MFKSKKLAETSKTQPTALTLSPTALNMALAQSALQARRMAEAFGVKVPYAKAPLVTKKRSVGVAAAKP